MWKTGGAPVTYLIKVHLCAKFTFELNQSHEVNGVREAFDIQCLRPNKIRSPLSVLCCIMMAIFDVNSNIL